MSSSNVSSAISTTGGLINTFLQAKATLASDLILGNNIATDQTNLIAAQTALISNLESVWGLNFTQAYNMIDFLSIQSNQAILVSIINSAAALQAL